MTKSNFLKLSDNEKDYMVDKIIENISDFVDRDGNLDSWSRKGLLNIINAVLVDINEDRK